MSIASWTSPPASASTLPISRAISSASSCLVLGDERARSGTGSRRASAPARGASSRTRPSRPRPPGRRLPRPTAGRSPISSPVAGLRLSNVSPPSAPTHSPPIKFWTVSRRVATRGESSPAAGYGLVDLTAGTCPECVRAGGPRMRALRRRRGRRSRWRVAPRAAVDDRPSRPGCPCSTRRACRTARPRAPAGRRNRSRLLIVGLGGGASPRALFAGFVVRQLGTSRPAASSSAFQSPAATSSSSELEAPLAQPHRLGLEDDAVLVPGDVPARP